MGRELVMNTKGVIKSQYQVSLAMWRQAIEKYPEEFWAETAYVNLFWHLVLHVLFYTHFYLLPTITDFVPWAKHREEIVSLGTPVDELTPNS